MIEGFHRIQQVQTDLFELELSLNRIGSQCSVSIRPKAEHVIIEPTGLRLLLKKWGIVKGIDHDAIVEICQKVSKGKGVRDVVVAMGKLPQREREGYLEFNVRVSTTQPYYVANASGSIDYKDTHLFENVNEGQLVAIRKPPIRAQNGYTVSGKVLMPRPSAAPAAEVNVKLGPGITMKGRDIIATTSGRVIYENDEISISDELLIKGNVDFDSGHIDFIGYVQVNGDVMDGFNVKGKKGVRIRHNVGHSCIESKGDIELAGMTGEGGDGYGNSTIRCGRNFRARYLRNVDVECDGDVEIVREALHCMIKAGGTIRIKGMVANSQCTALRGIEVGVVGTELGVETTLSSGRDFRLLEKRQKLQKRLSIVKKHKKMLDNLAGPYVKLHNLGGLKTAVREKLKKVLRHSQAITARVKMISEELDSLNRSDTVEGANPKVNILKVLHRGTVISLGKVRITYDQDLKGPISLVEHLGITLFPAHVTPLDIAASVVQKTIQAKEISPAPPFDDA